MSGVVTFASAMVGTCCGMLIANGMVNLLNARIIRRIARQEIVNFAILNSACPTEEYANIMRDQWAEWINDVR